MDISKLIHERRIKMRLSQRDLGQLCGYKGNFANSIVYHWEHGNSLPPLDKLRKLAEALQLPLESLIP